MKVSLNLAQEYSNVDLKAIPRDELLHRIGAQLGAVEDVTDWAQKFEGAVVVRVVECKKHENADKLSVCQVDYGSGKTVQVVCGAPNVRADMYAVWLKPGVVVPNSRDTDPFTLEAREIRGVVSNGMLASAHELGISEDHSGIVEITAQDAGREPVPGEPLTAYFGLDDFVVTCENKMFTHRPDCFGNLGVARELAGIAGLNFKSPDWYQNAPTFDDKSDLPIEVKNDVPELVPRFMAVAMQNITVGPSPMWLQSTLARVGIKPINNVVDVSNYVMHLTGQPTHAFDYDKIRELSIKPGIFPRMAKKGEKITLLGQKDIKLSGEEIVIATDKQAVALGGVMGGADTEVDENTKNIIIECATFDMYSIRRTSMRYGLFTDAVTRYNKGQSPLQNDRVLAFLMGKMNELAGAQQASSVHDIKSDLQQSEVPRFEVKFINERLGSSFELDEIKQLLSRVEFEFPNVEGQGLLVQPPFWRTDIEIIEDIVEEVGRLHGYDQLPVELPKRTAKPASKNSLLDSKASLRQSLKQFGANEVLTYSFVHGDLLQKSNIDPAKWTYHIRNAISPDLQYYRPSIIPSLLAKVHPNIKAQAGTDDNQFALFEIGRAHVKGHEKDNLPVQMERLALIVAADDKTARAHQSGASYYLAKKYLEEITDGQAVLSPVNSFDFPVTAPFAPGRSAEVRIGDTVLGVIGEFSPKVRRSLKLPDFVAGFELDISLLNKYLAEKSYRPLPPFPGTHQDYTHEVSGNTSWQAVSEGLLAALNQSNTNNYEISIEPLDIFEAADTGSKRLTFRVFINHPNKTLKTEEATALLESASHTLSKNLDAQQG